MKPNVRAGPALRAALTPARVNAPSAIAERRGCPWGGTDHGRHSDSTTKRPWAQHRGRTPGLSHLLDAFPFRRHRRADRVPRIFSRSYGSGSARVLCVVAR